MTRKHYYELMPYLSFFLNWCHFLYVFLAVKSLTPSSLPRGALLTASWHDGRVSLLPLHFH